MSNEVMTLTQKIFNESMSINSMIHDRTTDPVIFFDYSGHTSGLRLDIFALGWDSERNNVPTRSFVAYLDDDCYLEKLKEMLTVLTAIRTNCTK